MFKKKDENQDMVHHTNIKRGITAHFAKTLKILQQKYLQSDNAEFIYSNDSSNNLCNSLEAVFLHGLKDSVTQKLTAYVGLAPTAPVAQQNLNFWSVAAKFTHKDVVTQLQALSQISTEIGWCRAWVRLALNDGLMQSYIHSMIADVKTLRYFYHSYSYLRDFEQPGILNNLLTGLMSLDFKMSLNSSVLNSWTNGTLQLVGALDSQTVPPPSISQVLATPSQVQHSQSQVQHSQRQVQHSQSQVQHLQNDKHSQGERNSVRLVQDVAPTQPVGEIRESSIFGNLKDFEDLHNTVSALSQSEGSTCSHVSCPDPGPYVFSQAFTSTYESRSREASSTPPLLEVKDCGKESTSSIKENVNISPIPEPASSEWDYKITPATGPGPDETHEVEMRGKSHVVLDDPNLTEIAASPSRPRSRRVSEDDLVHLSPTRPSPSYMDELTSRLSLTKSPQRNSHVEEIKSPSVSSPNSLPNSESGHQPSVTADVKDKPRLRNYEEICASLPPLKLSEVEQEAILHRVLHEIDRQADKDRELRETTAVEQAQKVVYPNSHINKVVPLEDSVAWVASDINTHLKTQAKHSDTKSSVQKTSLVKPDKNKDNSDLLQEGRQIPDLNKEETGKPHQDASIEMSGGFETGDRPSEGKLEPVQIPSNTNQTENEANDYSSGRFGNSLSGMSGWSSEFDAKSEKKNSELESSRGESFASMLRTYAPASEESNKVVTLDQFLGTLRGDEEEEVLSNPGSERNSSRAEEELQRQDSCLADFEVLQPTTECFHGQVEANCSRMIFLFRIPRELGLSHQNFTCRGCACPIGIIYGQPRMCEFDGGLYCTECHDNNETYLPSSIIFNWDFRKKKVSNENFKFLQELEDQAVYDVEQLNPKLYNHVPELMELKLLRVQLCYLRSYLFTCSQKVAETLRQKVWPREHLYDHRDVYSLTDFLQVPTSSLHKLLKELIKFATLHVYDCLLCSQKGFVCEICRNPKVIYPFETDSTIRCKVCKAVYHKTCMTENLPCPKCERWGRRHSSSNNMGDHPEDYGMSPPLS
ncbi:pleckstrin homology domain-containing family M member 1-like [Physella acuta]|uniref:pleckstrin homology domain-containing family M member 1-like n=1 Tax=Physella acuta TaxID=109671 RepID=UPI0027DD6571|nr:pleckstrin homology domain-containing family M member 1-like [Physella acuta]